MVMLQSLLMALKHQNQDNVIDVVASTWATPVLARMPEVRSTVEVNIAHGELQLGKRIHVGKSLRSQYDQAIILPRSYKSALIPYFAKIPQRTAYRGEMRYGIVNDMRYLNKGVTYKAVERFVNLGTEATKSTQTPKIHFPKLRVDLGKRHQAAQRIGVSENIPAIGLMPGAEFGPSKRWPAEYFGELASAFKREGYNVYIFGSVKDHAIGEEIVTSSNGGAKNLCGQTTLEEVIDLISLVKVAITNDSGLMHIATAVDRPVVVIYGATTPKYTPTIIQYCRNTVSWFRL